jgi:hypothetical protein
MTEDTPRSRSGIGSSAPEISPSRLGNKDGSSGYNGNRSLGTILGVEVSVLDCKENLSAGA